MADQTGTPTLALSDFLLARIAEDETEAAHVFMVWDFFSGDGHSLKDRVLAECAAKRHIVERCSPNRFEWAPEYLASGILADLALPYADHPDYRPEWRP